MKFFGQVDGKEAPLFIDQGWVKVGEIGNDVVVAWQRDGEPVYPPGLTATTEGPVRVRASQTLFAKALAFLTSSYRIFAVIGRPVGVVSTVAIVLGVFDSSVSLNGEKISWAIRSTLNVGADVMIGLANHAYGYDHRQGPGRQPTNPTIPSTPSPYPSPPPPPSGFVGSTGPQGYQGSLGGEDDEEESDPLFG